MTLEAFAVLVVGFIVLVILGFGMMISLRHGIDKTMRAPPLPPPIPTTTRRKVRPMSELKEWHEVRARMEGDLKNVIHNDTQRRVAMSAIDLAYACGREDMKADIRAAETAAKILRSIQQEGA